MKILQIIPYFCFGGAETMCENLCYAQKQLGHQVSVVSLYNEHTPIAQRMEQAGIAIRYLDKKLGLDVSMVPKLYRIMKEERPDVVHTHLDVIKYGALAARLAGVPHCIHTVHSVAEKEAEGLARKVNNLWFRLGLSTPVALTPQIQKTIVDVYGLEESRVPVIFNGIDLSRCTPKTGYALNGGVRLVHVGRFDAPKNHHGLLRAFRLLKDDYPDSRLTLVGDGDLRPEIEALAGELGLRDSVEFAGFQSDVHPCLEQADIFTLPSLYEGMPMTIIEAMATALPITATRVGGIPDLIHDRHSALLTDCDTVEIYKAWKTLIEDEDLRRRLGQNARLESVQFSSEEMARRYCRLCQQD